MENRERNVRYFGIFLLVAGVGLTLWGGFVAVQGWLSATWPTTEGTIVAARVAEKVNVNATAVEEDKLNYVPAIQYSYTVDDQLLTADNLRYFEDPQFGVRADAQAVVDDYQPGDPITVYYNPNNSAEALLQPGADAANFIPLGFGLFGLLSGLLFVLRPDLV